MTRQPFPVQLLHNKFTLSLDLKKKLYNWSNFNKMLLKQMGLCKKLNFTPNIQIY